MLVSGPRAAQACLRSAPLAIRSRLVQANLTIRIPRTSPALPQLRHLSFSPHRSSNQSNQPRTPDAIFAPSVDPNNPRPRRRRRWRASLIFLIVGFSLGTALRFTLSPPTPPAQGSAEDEYLTEKIRKNGDSLALVQALSMDPKFTSWDAYSGFSSPTTHTAKSNSTTVVQSRITSGPLAGSRGLPFQRIFHNTSTGEVMSVLYFGSGTGGWPGVVHGGALATLLDESLGRCAILQFPARTGVTARLELQYRQPTLTSGFYVIRARPMIDEREPAEKRERKLWVEGTLETMDGKTCVEAKALFVVPKGVKLKPLVEGF